MNMVPPDSIRKPAVVRRARKTLGALRVALLTGGFDRPYVFGLTKALMSESIVLDVIGSDDLDGPEMHRGEGLNFLNLHGAQRQGAGFFRRLLGVLAFYACLLRYATSARPMIFHILWNNKFPVFDRTVLMLYYKLRGKRIVLTAHNVNAGKRDSNDSALNRLTLRVQYRLADRIFVHTDKMKGEIHKTFGVRGGAVTVIPFGINNTVPDTDLSSTEAKRRLGIGNGERTILFFGNIGPYKGLDLLVAAFQRIVARNGGYRLVIAGKPRGGCDTYVRDIQETIRSGECPARVLARIEYIPDDETEIYFKAADVMVLPYREVSQSGVLFLGYGFGLPVIATDVGSFRDDIVEGKTGFLCPPGDPVCLAKTIESYFESDLYKGLFNSRQEIRDYAEARHSWTVVGEITRGVYEELLAE